MQPVYLVCGVSGSGKTWVCEQLTELYNWVPQANHFNNHVKVLVNTARTSDKPVLTECPFAESFVRDSLENAGVTVYPYFVIEETKVVQERYLAREGKPLPKNAETRNTSIKERARDWKAPYGPSSSIRDILNLRSVLS